MRLGRLRLTVRFLGRSMNWRGLCVSMLLSWQLLAVDLLAQLSLTPHDGKIRVLFVRLLLMPLNRPVAQSTRAPILPP